ncbi:hypothetical protein [Conexibacter arvalis]|uniref:Uncharacterized protein n=1 Tax=Conexibacter arvalis TaxID=912552 RepID=A0A840IIZ0_9ACTN|nr:hypothetical protein [Conexibacter arvalis]MBB4664962.1 hypothetical protein [Conexibacter arvalis]
MTTASQVVHCTAPHPGPFGAPERLSLVAQRSGDQATTLKIEIIRRLGVTDKRMDVLVVEADRRQEITVASRVTAIVLALETLHKRGMQLRHRKAGTFVSRWDVDLCDSAGGRIASWRVRPQNHDMLLDLQIELTRHAAPVSAEDGASDGLTSLVAHMREHVVERQRDAQIEQLAAANVDMDLDEYLALLNRHGLLNAAGR